MIADLREVGIEYKSSNSQTKYNVSLEVLKDISKKFKWGSNDDLEELNDNLLYKSNDDEIVHVGVSSIAYETVCSERDDLKQQLHDLREQMNKLNTAQLTKVTKVKKVVKTVKPKKVEKTVKVIKTKKKPNKQKSLLLEFNSL
jgi:hypothetical protein